MRLGRMAAQALDNDVPAIARGHGRAGPEAELVDRHARHIVQAEDRITGKTLEQTVFHHGARAGIAAFFGGLEDEIHRAVEIRMRGQVLGRAKQDGGVAVMAAAMHAPRDGGLMLETVVLGHGQGVHVGAQSHRFLAAAGAQYAHHTGFPQAGVDFQSQRAQALGHQVGGAGLLEGQLRMRMDVAPQGGQLTVRALDFV